MMCCQSLVSKTKQKVLFIINNVLLYRAHPPHPSYFPSAERRESGIPAFLFDCRSSTPLPPRMKVTFKATCPPIPPPYARAAAGTQQLRFLRVRHNYMMMISMIIVQQEEEHTKKDTKTKISKRQK